MHGMAISACSFFLSNIVHESGYSRIPCQANSWMTCKAFWIGIIKRDCSGMIIGPICRVIIPIRFNPWWNRNQCIPEIEWIIFYVAPGAPVLISVDWAIDEVNKKNKIIIIIIIIIDFMPVLLFSLDRLLNKISNWLIYIQFSLLPKPSKLNCTFFH